MLKAKTRTTVALPSALLEAVDRAVLEGIAASRNEFLAAALRHELARCRRGAIDAAFAGMADDADYQREALDVTESFASADWEALGIVSPRRPWSESTSLS